MAASLHRPRGPHQVMLFPVSVSLPALLSSTKRLIVDVIRFQPGETLTEILDTPATAEQVRVGPVGHQCRRWWW